MPFFVSPAWKKTVFLLVGAAAIIGAVLQQHEQCTPSGPPLLIFDTDISSDVDDVGALALLHHLADQGKVRILAMLVSSANPWSVPCLATMNAWFGRPEIPIGAVKGTGVLDESKYTRIIAEEFSQNGIHAEVPDAVRLSRRILAGQADRSVTMVAVGYLSNLRNLLLSGADDSSPLDGISLVRRKVERLVCMGGQYPSGMEWNFSRDAAAAAQVAASWPTPVVFSGFEIGRDILTGAALKDVPQPNPVRRSYELHNGLVGRPSWDQAAVYYAVTTAGGRRSRLWSRVYGKNIVENDGSNYWIDERSGQGNHAYLVQRGDAARIADLLEQLMLTAGR